MTPKSARDLNPLSPVAAAVGRSAVTLAVATVVVMAACGRTPSSPALGVDADSARTQNAWFTESAEAAGIDFVHVNGASGRFYYPEILPPGVGLFDYDNDGDLDVYLVQGRTLGAPQPNGSPAGAARDDSAFRGRLYRNDLQVQAGGARTLHFTDVTAASGIVADQFGLGVAAADVDNDGWVDLFLTSFGTNQLWRNNGDGTFADVSKARGVHDTAGRFSVSAAFLDYDRDGWLDLYVANNANYTLQNETSCPNMAGARDYCPPQIYGGQPDRLYHNQGQGRFVDVSAAALVGGAFGPALGVATADYDGDGWIDIFVANDGEENLLWMNQRDGTFRDNALMAGAAITDEGKAEASMGVDAGDFDNDGDDDLFMTELTSQGSNLYANDGHGVFRDVSASSGLGHLSVPYTGWGTGWFDFDNDGWLDILSVNGTIVASDGRTTQSFPYDQKKVLFRNQRNGKFENVTGQAGPAFELSESGRGAAFGDVDNDGDVDVLVGNDGGRARLLINNLGNRQHWLGLRLVGAGRDQLGARITVIRGDGSRIWRRARSDGSYGSANDPRVLVGLGPSTESPKVQVLWPSGRVEEWSDVIIDRWTTLKEGNRR